MQLEQTMKNLRARGFEVSCFKTSAEAAAHVAGQLKGETVGIGGSKTIEALGLYETLGQNNTVLWHWKNPEDKERFGEFTAYLTSANAVAATGELVNIDGAGNRVAATLYGPKKLYYICGVNKIAPDLPSAIERARNVASPLNAKRFNLSTPCAVDGRCHDCRSPQRICNGMVIQMGKMKASDYTEVVLIEEELGM